MRQRVRHALAAFVIIAAIVTGWRGITWGQPAAPPGAPPRLTLQQAIQTALEKHPGLQSAEIAEQTVRERDVVRRQVETLYRNQLKSKLDLGLVQVQLSDAEFLVIRARNDLVTAFAELNNAMGIEGPAAYTLEEIPILVESPRALSDLVEEAKERRPELLALKERVRTAEHRI